MNKNELIAEYSTKNDVGKSEATKAVESLFDIITSCLLYTSPSPRDATLSRMPSSA